MGSTVLKTVAPIDFAMIAAYMLLMLGIGFYAMRFNRGAADYFKGGNRVHWLAAGLSSFMSGFSAWTFTGAAGLAYQHGLVAVLLYVGNACTFLLGYFIFAARWRRARISTVMEYLVDRFDERTRQTFSWGTIFFQFFTGASMLYGLALFVAPACGWPLSWTIVGSGAVILAYCVVGGLWAVVITDFLQAAILMPFTLVMGWTALSRVGGLHGLLASLPPDMTTLRSLRRVRLVLRALLDGHDELRLQHRGHGPALLQRGRRGLGEEDRTPLLRPVRGGGGHLVPASAGHACPAPRLDRRVAGSQEPPGVRRTRWPP